MPLPVRDHQCMVEDVPVHRPIDIGASLRYGHGTAASYDMSRSVTLTGVVTEYVFTNPHSQLYIDVKDNSGEIVHWACELNSPGNLRRDGWSKQTFKPGDQVTLSVNPSKAGAQYGTVDRSKPVIVNGKELPGRSNNVD